MGTWWEPAAALTCTLSFTASDVLQKPCDMFVQPVARTGGVAIDWWGFATDKTGTYSGKYETARNFVNGDRSFGGSIVLVASDALSAIPAAQLGKRTAQGTFKLFERVLGKIGNTPKVAGAPKIAAVPPSVVAPGAVGRSEISNSVSNLGRGARGVDEFAPGTAFSGVYDPKTKQLLAYPSSRNPNNLPREAVLKDGTVVSENVVGRNAGHAEVNDVLSSLTKHPGANENNVGFTLFLREDGNLGVEWFSRSVNRNNPTFKGDVVPKNLQSEIRRELQKLFPGKVIE